MKIIVKYHNDKKPLEFLMPGWLFIKLLTLLCTNSSFQKYGINLSEKNLKILKSYFSRFKKHYKSKWKKQYKNWKIMEISCNSGEKIEILL